MNNRKLLSKALTGSRGSHHVFAHPILRELVNLQEVSGKAKPYQVRQLLDLVERYNLQLDNEQGP